MNTDYNLYKIFLYLYEEKSISKTASKLYVSQPAISYSLKELESQLGYTLFYRNSKGIEPTMEAKELYNYISTAFNILNDAEEHMKNLNALNVGTIKIGIPSYIGIFYLTNYIVNFRKLFPGIKFEIISKSTSELLEMLENRKLDIVIDDISIDCNKNITKASLSKLNSCFVFNKKMYKNISIKELNDLEKYPLILPNSNLSIRKRLNDYMNNNNIKLNPVLESHDVEIMLEMVRSGIGIGYFLKKFIDGKNDKDDFELISFDYTLPVFDLSLFYVDEFLTMASKKFIDILKNN